MRAVLVFDINCIGLMRWCRHRLELLGFKCIKTKYKDDDLILEYRRRLEEAYGVPAIVITYDRRDFPREQAIILNQHNKFEEQVTALLRALADRLGEMCQVGQPLTRATRRSLVHARTRANPPAPQGVGA